MKTVVISSSMKYKELIKKTIKAFNEIGINAVFPNINYSKPGDEGLSQDEKKMLAESHYKAIREADFIYFILPAGYMGTSCKLELGYALAVNKPIYFSEATGDMGLDCYFLDTISLDNLEMFK